MQKAFDFRFENFRIKSKNNNIMCNNQTVCCVELEDGINLKDMPMFLIRNVIPKLLEKF